MSGIFAAYHLATLADFRDVGVISLLHDPRVSASLPTVARETRVAGAARAFAKAICHVTAKRARRAPPLDKLPT